MGCALVLSFLIALDWACIQSLQWQTSSAEGAQYRITLGDAPHWWHLAKKTIRNPRVH